MTRAKQKVTVVSSFMYSDIDSSKVRPGTGLEFLKNYLEYANSGGRLFTNGELTSEPMNDFELDVFEALTTKGITLVPQLGCSNFRIDFAVCIPRSPAGTFWPSSAMVRPIIRATRPATESTPPAAT